MSQVLKDLVESQPNSTEFLETSVEHRTIINKVILHSRSCLNCVQYELCFLRHASERLIKQGTGLLSQAREEKITTPHTGNVIFTAVANACKKYESENRK